MDEKYMLCLLVSTAFFMLTSSCSRGSSETESYRTVIAGQFYPGNGAKLKTAVKGYLDSVNPDTIQGKITAVMVPHAGYDYSAGVASFSYKAILKQKVDAIILIAPMHTAFVDGIAIYPRGCFESPLGKLKIDEELAEKLIKNSEGLLKPYPQETQEQTAEAQVPFLLTAFEDFKFVPIVIGKSDIDDWKELSSALVKTVKGTNTVIVASTDMTHYPSYKDANEIDKKTLEIIATMDAEKLLEHINKTMSKGYSGLECVLCGEGPVMTAMIASKMMGADNAKILKYANSGDVMSSGRGVVGYGSVAFYVSEGEKKTAMENKDEILVSKENEKVLLKLARDTIESYVRDGKVPNFKTTDTELTQPLGCFVTLHKNGELRGCIGSWVGDKPLYQNVISMSIASSTQDPRFPVVTEKELKDLHIEISVFPSKLRKIDDPHKDILLGKHMVVVKKGFRQGVFLPQVATETGWSLEEFMGKLCSDKAGLAYDAWKNKDVEIHVSAPQVFEEEK